VLGSTPECHNTEIGCILNRLRQTRAGCVQGIMELECIPVGTASLRFFRLGGMNTSFQRPISWSNWAEFFQNPDCGKRTWRFFLETWSMTTELRIYTSGGVYHGYVWRSDGCIFVSRVPISLCLRSKLIGKGVSLALMLLIPQILGIVNLAWERGPICIKLMISRNWLDCIKN